MSGSSNTPEKAALKRRDLRWLIAGTTSTIVGAVGLLTAFQPSALPLYSLEVDRLFRFAGVACVVCSASVVLIITNARCLFNVSLAYTMVGNAFWGRSHWDIVYPGILLGGLPLCQHFEHLKVLGVTAVVSLVEPFELEQGAFFAPIQHSQWQKAGVVTKWIKTADFEPVSPKQLEAAADFIHEQLKQQNVPKPLVFVHCKAGRGRSTAAVLVYLWKYHNMSLQEAYRVVKTARPQINLNRRQMTAVRLATSAEETQFKLA